MPRAPRAPRAPSQPRRPKAEPAGKAAGGAEGTGGADGKGGAPKKDDAASTAAEPDAGGASAAPRAPRRPRSRPAARRTGAQAAPGAAPPGAAEGEPLAGAPGAPASEGEAEVPKAPRRRRRRRGGKKPPEEGEAAAPGKPAPKRQPAPGREPAGKKAPGPRAPAKGAASPASTRLAARAQRRQQQRGVRRPRRSLTEVEAKALRGADKIMLVHEHEDRTQIAVLEDRMLIEHYVAHRQGRSIAGNIYLGKVQNVLPGMEAAFIDIGQGRNAVLYAGEVNYSPEDLEGEAPRIERVLKSGQAVLVQVTKDALGTKGARLTAQISLPGRYVVLAPDQALSGISRRLSDDERSRLRTILRAVPHDGHGVIVRTAAEGASREELERDLASLVRRWEEIGKASKKAKAPALLYAEPELVMRVVRDLLSEDFVSVVVDTRALYERIAVYLEEFAPHLADRLRLHEEPLPLFDQHHVTEQIHKALERKVWLPSGGSIVIDRTEAMTVIDVNTGKFVGKGGTLEETVFKNNLEAAEEVARQLRLRDIGGIIVIDFIDMIIAANREQVLRTLKRALGRDKTRSQVFEVSSLGLVEMTRKKVSEGLLDAFSEPCPNCSGRGIVITHELD
ncbi:MAG: Rne/Rng family ribonuclease [Acidobacteria bacterium]|nr:Rne/Rng family ribonuclease [Acidobacteriota bacterium]